MTSKCILLLYLRNGLEQTEVNFEHCLVKCETTMHL